MNKFSDFNIESEHQGLIGNKINIEQVLNREIIVHSYRIENSKYDGKGNGYCLYLQITIDDEKRVLFTGSGVLMDRIKRVPERGFPFIATIVKNNKWLEFR